MREATDSRQDLLGFKVCEIALGTCHTAIKDTTDSAQIVRLLKKAYAAMADRANGPAASAVVPAREQLQKIWGKL